jgi:hypothetical protein
VETPASNANECKEAAKDANKRPTREEASMAAALVMLETKWSPD